MNDFISELETLVARRKHLEEEINRISLPRVTDLSRMDELFSLFCQVTGATPEEVATDKGFARVSLRWKFLMTAVMLYFPAWPVSRKMPNGLRKAIARCLGMKYSSLVSYNFRDISFQYRRCPGVSREIDRIFGRMAERLEAENGDKSDTIIQ